MDHPGTVSEHLQDMYKNVGRTLATQRRSREEASIALRKKKREEFFTAKRAEFTGTLPVGPLDSYESFSIYDSKVTEGLFSDDPEKIDFSLMVYIARLEKSPEKAQTEFWDMMNFNVLSALIKILNDCEHGSHRQFLTLRILAQVSEDSDIAVAINEGTSLIKYILWKFISFDEKCMGEVLMILSNTVSSSLIPTSSEQALFVIDRCKRICYESPMTHIRALAALVMTKVIDNLEEGIHIPVNLVNFAGDLIVSGEVRLRISGYCLFNSFFCDYRMGNAVVSSDKWLPALERCSMVNTDESYEIFYLLENLCNFMLPYELQRAHLLERMWSIIEDSKFQSSDKQLRALGVLTELSVASPEKMQLLLDSNPRAQESLANLLVNANFDTRRQVLLLLRNLFLNLPHSIPILAGQKTIEGISDLLTVMQPDTVVFALECLKGILDHGGSPADDNGNGRGVGNGDYSNLAEEANVHSRLDFLVSSPNEQVALLAMEILHTHVDTKEDDGELPDDLKDIDELQMFLDRKLGLAESYLDGDWNADPGPKDLLTLLIRARTESSSKLRKTKRKNSLFSSVINYLIDGIRKSFFLFNYLQHKLRENTLSQSRKNIKDHYDLGNEMFKLFLDDSMTYSCGVFGDGFNEKITKPDKNKLYEAQMKKYDLLLEKLDLKESDHVLEIGCGWGACGIRAVEKYGCRWTGLTISEEQFVFAREKIEESGLENKIEIKFLDYRKENGIYDKVISIEMIEAVGHDFLPVYFQKISNNLKPGGRAVIQAILCPDEYYDNYRKSSDFIKKHIFPGGHMPALKAISQALPQDLEMEEDIRKIGIQYAKTLDFWTAAWLQSRSKIHHLGYSEYFFRKWEFYFVLCSSLFEYEVGPFDSILKAYIGGAKDFMERVLVQVKVPKIVQNPSGGGVSFQLDQPPDGTPTPECKECKLHASEALVGTWHLILLSNNFLTTVIADLDSQIDKLESNQPISEQKSLFEWLADPPDISCPQLTIFSAEAATKFEFAYTVNPGGKHKSIINKWDRQADSSILWHLTPVLKVHVCPTVVEPDLIVLRQIDSFPRCDNVIVLIRRDLTNVRIDSIRDTLEAERLALPSNALMRTKCPLIIL